MSLTLLLDEDVWAGLAGALRERGYDAVAVTEIGRKGLPDEQQLDFAAENGRAILTHNIRDFAPLAQQYAVQEKPHAGIIVVYQLSKGELLNRTIDLLEDVTAAQLANTLRFL